ncbi:MAG: DUF72 domain-containing protein [Bacteroidota bacterium]
MNTTSFHIGCSGYYYGYWKDRFYPKGMKPAQWLEYYSSVFDTVELNAPFYRIPQKKALQRYAQQTPDAFKFAVKMNKGITHLARMKDVQERVLEFQDILTDGLGSKLSFCLFQLPGSFRYSEENLERILENVPHFPHNVVEFRHESWWNPKVYEALRSANITFCNVDYPGLNTPFQLTSSFSYLRLHGSPELFKSAYSTEQLSDFLTRIPAGAEGHSIYCNNTYYEAGYQNAAELVELSKALHHA